MYYGISSLYLFRGYIDEKQLLDFAINLLYEYLPIKNLYKHIKMKNYLYSYILLLKKSFTNKTNSKKETWTTKFFEIYSRHRNQFTLSSPYVPYQTILSTT